MRHGSQTQRHKHPLSPSGPRGGASLLRDVRSLQGDASGAAITWVPPPRPPPCCDRLGVPSTSGGHLGAPSTPQSPGRPLHIRRSVLPSPAASAVVVNLGTHTPQPDWAPHGSEPHPACPPGAGALVPFRTQPQKSPRVLFLSEQSLACLVSRGTQTSPSAGGWSGQSHHLLKHILPHLQQ